MFYNDVTWPDLIQLTIAIAAIGTFVIALRNNHNNKRK